MPDCEWLMSTTLPTFWASCDSRGTVGLGVGSVPIQSGTICFQNSSIASSGKRMPGYTWVWVSPKRKIAHAASCPAMNTGGVSPGARLPARTAVTSVALAAERPRET